jgi:hypothetical protein
MSVLSISCMNIAYLYLLFEVSSNFTGFLIENSNKSPGDSHYTWHKLAQAKHF